MVDPLSITFGILALICSVAAYIYRKKYRESEKRYRSQVNPSPPLLPVQPIKSKEILERERWLKIRSEILLRDHFRCKKCGYYKHLEVHHIISRCKGGGDNPENLVTLCTRCHGNVHGFEKHRCDKKHWKKKHGHGRHNHRNHRKKEKQYFKQYKKEFIIHETLSKDWDKKPEDAKRKRREEMYEHWRNDELNQS